MEPNVYSFTASEVLKLINDTPAVDLKAEFLSQRSTGKTGLPFIERPNCGADMRQDESTN
jgi:hypothetical protein